MTEAPRFGTPAREIPDDSVVPASIPQGKRQVSVRCPKHKGRLIAVMTEEWMYFGAEPVRRVTAVVTQPAYCGKCRDFYDIDPRKVLEVKRGVRGPVNVEAGRVAPESRS